MEPPTTNSKSSLFQVYLRLRPPQLSTQHLYPTLPTPDRFLTVEEPTAEQLEDGTASPTTITLNPPNENRRRAVEKFAFTRVFEEESSQLDLFHGTEGRDGLLATLGVTGSGKSHTILGSRSQRGLTQLALDLLFRSIDNNILDVKSHPGLNGSIASSDPSEAQIMSAQMFLDTYYFDPALSRGSSRAATPQVGDSYQPTPETNDTYETFSFAKSHGFFCVEVKKRRRARIPGPWGGSSLTVVDLAGSERARDTKTAGATLAEAGKINESLMYLGQCLQMQSDLESNAKPNLVPFRQCKLTELLFSNSFPLNSSKPLIAHHRNPPRGIMIVTADPLGDFNATSQILRYSALAKEITVPRVPSITATILGSSQSSDKHPELTSPTSPTYPRYRDGPSHIPTETERETMEIAALEIARMSEEIDGLRAELERETRLRMQSEAHLQSMEDRMLDLEMDIREECFEEMERRIQEESRKWMVRLEEHGEREEEWRDRKVEVLVRGLSAGIYGDEDKENQISDATTRLEMENAKLLREVDRLKRELNSRSPTKPRKPSSRILMESRTHAMNKSASPVPNDAEDQALELRESMARLKVDDVEVSDVKSATGKMRIKKNTASTGSPTKRVRKLTTRKWDMGDDDL
ncbi:hypothetical protein DID88_001129 [Monilinia fructigena]|uniref:Kinesin-like protein n=1 Tax=Monilinia fructigena TaxID=38457 RepID=A0A395IXY2_9HELO|nr:hypothetical protein DID88_001129 [Monilinia fructigena]